MNKNNIDREVTLMALKSDMTGGVIHEPKVSKLCAVPASAEMHNTIPRKKVCFSILILLENNVLLVETLFYL